MRVEGDQEIVTMARAPRDEEAGEETIGEAPKKVEKPEKKDDGEQVTLDK